MKYLQVMTFASNSFLMRTLRRCFVTQGNSEFFDYLQKRIQISGPITVASYMQEALTNPKWGYYMKRDVFGTAGDFTTSPEISQMLGEMVGIWLLNEWLQAEQPKDVKLVELGPGRGTLMADILRVFSQLKIIKESLSVHLIEVSQEMRRMQKGVLCNVNSTDRVTDEATPSKYGVNVHWHSYIKDVPDGYTLYLAHEFFDALPVHLFRKTEKGWREVLVDIDSTGLRFVLAPGSSPLSDLFIPKDTTLQEYEVCPEAGVIIEHMRNTIGKNGGSGLIVDYGKDGPSSNSLRSFKNHKLVDDILQYPGDADITANVDFSYLKRTMKDGVRTYGPVTQSIFLKAMGIEARHQVLSRNATEEQKKHLDSAYDYLLSEDKMGEKFKVLAFNQNGASRPAAF